MSNTRNKKTAAPAEEVEEVADIVSEEMGEQPTVPTLIITFDEYGDIVYQTPNSQLDITLALSMLELAKIKVASQFFATINQERARQLATKPKLLLPN